MKIIVIVIDALRADSLSCYGYRRSTTPAIDRIAGEGVLFKNAYTQSNWTNPALYSLITGLYPSRHGIDSFERNLGGSVLTLPAWLVGKGYRTLLFSNYLVLIDRKRFGKHFQRVEYFDIDRDAEKLIAEIDSRRDQNLFALIHIGNYVHEPYCASPEEVRLFWDGDFPRRKIIRALTEERGQKDEEMQNVLRKVNLRRERLSRMEVEFLKACYDAGIRHLDNRLVDFFEYLRDSSDDEITLIITADHGQGFFEHGFFGHGLNLNQELIRVPLIFWRKGFPPVAPRESIVQLIDIFPTLAELTGDVLEVEDGSSFAGCFRGEEEIDRWAVSEGFPFLAGVHQGKKMILSAYRLMRRKESVTKLKGLLRKGRYRKLLLHLYSIFRTGFYDLENDPEETENLIGKDPVAGDIREYLRDWYRKISAAEPDTVIEEIGEEKTIEQLKSLGYL